MACVLRQVWIVKGITLKGNAVSITFSYVWNGEIKMAKNEVRYFVLPREKRIYQWFYKISNSMAIHDIGNKKTIFAYYYNHSLTMAGMPYISWQSKDPQHRVTYCTVLHPRRVMVILFESLRMFQITLLEDNPLSTNESVSLMHLIMQILLKWNNIFILLHMVLSYVSNVTPKLKTLCLWHVQLSNNHRISFL